MAKSKEPRKYKQIECLWEPTEGLRAIEEVEYEEKWERGELQTTEISRLWGFVNEEGETIIEIQYDCVWKFKDNRSKVRKGKAWGVIDTTGEVIIPIIYQTLHFHSDGLIQVQLNGRWGYIDERGTTVIEAKYDYIFPFREGFAGIKLNGKYGFINAKGDEVIMPQYDEVGLVNSDYSVKVRIGNIWNTIRL